MVVHSGVVPSCVRWPTAVGVAFCGVPVPPPVMIDSSLLRGRYNLTITNDGHAKLKNVAVSDPSLVTGTKRFAASLPWHRAISVALCYVRAALVIDCAQRQSGRRVVSWCAWRIVGEIRGGECHLHCCPRSYFASCHHKPSALAPRLRVADGESTLDCGTAAHSVEGNVVVLESELELAAEVTCTGSHVITAADVDNLERESSASVTAVDEYSTEVTASSTEIVVLDQVCAEGPRRAIVRLGALATRGTRFQCS